MNSLKKVFVEVTIFIANRNMIDRQEAESFLFAISFTANCDNSVVGQGCNMKNVRTLRVECT